MHDGSRYSSWWNILMFPEEVPLKREVESIFAATLKISFSFEH
jgi:hypothetical protein